jgi:PAS domain S-box-containing protein
MSDFYRRASKKLEKLSAEQLRELLVSVAGRKSLLETVLDSLPDGILVCDDRHCLIMANKCAQRMFPLEYEDSEKIPLWMAVRDERVVEFFQEALLNNDRVLDREIDLEIQGRNRLLSISILPLVQNHRITGSLVYVEDITEKRGREARLRRVESLASLTTMAAGVAHEIKTPLGSISIHRQLMQKALDRTGWDEKAAPLNKYIAVLNEEVDRLNRIVVDFLFAVRPVSLEPREGDVNKLIKDLRDFVLAELEQSGIECILELEDNIPHVLMDERYMKQALLNLVNNARAAMAGGGELLIKTALADGEIVITISDNGMGISAENLSKIFEPYFTTKDTGTGLGLTIVFKIIKEHQGEINVQSRLGEGSCFTVTLPVIQKQPRLIAWNTGGVEQGDIQ